MRIEGVATKEKLGNVSCRGLDILERGHCAAILFLMGQSNALMPPLWYIQASSLLGLAPLSPATNDGTKHIENSTP